MAMLMEGEITLTWKGGLVEAEDETGQRVCIRLQDFYRALENAQLLRSEIARSCAAQIVKLDERGPMFLRECPG
jgi:hypothetical protein